MRCGNSILEGPLAGWKPEFPLGRSRSSCSDPDPGTATERIVAQHRFYDFEKPLRVGSVHEEDDFAWTEFISVELTRGLAGNRVLQTVLECRHIVRFIDFSWQAQCVQMDKQSLLAGF